MWDYWYFTLGNKEVYIDVKTDRPLSIALHRDKRNRSVSVWLGWVYLLISRNTS